MYGLIFIGKVFGCKNNQCWVIQVEINIFVFVHTIEKAEVKTLALHLHLDGSEVLLGLLLYFMS
jgi:hypothetical protein